MEPMMNDEWRVESMSDEGVVEIVFPDDARCTITVPREFVPKFRRIVEMDRDRARDRRDVSGHLEVGEGREGHGR